MTGSDGLRVAMLTPCFWPEVRRGTERMVHELSCGLIARAHDPTVITSHRGLPSRGVEEGVPVVRVPRLPDGRLRRRWYEDHLVHVPFSYAALRVERPDVAHAWFTTDALAAARYRRLSGRPAVHSYMGIPDHDGLMWKRRRLEITVRAVNECDVTVALSRHAADEFRRWLGYDAPVIHPPVDVETFAPGPERTPEPTIVCAAALDEPRKRVDLLVRAFARVRREHPQARLVLDRPRDGSASVRVADPEQGIELADMDNRAELARLYGSAWVSVLPSVNEAFGLVLAEALACGTPAVGSDCDGIPEVIDRPEIGRLFSGGEKELAVALLEAIELARDPTTAAACRGRALELSSERCTEAYEALYRDLLEA
jgi:glycosyltransferase involved in cell wall biosynthesis